MVCELAALCMKLVLVFCHLYAAQFMETLKSDRERPLSCEDQDNIYLVFLGIQNMSTTADT